MNFQPREIDFGSLEIDFGSPEMNFEPRQMNFEPLRGDFEALERPPERTARRLKRRQPLHALLVLLADATTGGSRSE